MTEEKNEVKELTEFKDKNIDEIKGVVSMRQLLEAGVHFGHQTKRWDPRMKKFIYTARNDIHVIDLQKSLKKLNEAYEFVKKIVSQGGKILFVGTKKQAQEAVKEEAEKCGMYYVNQRWLGGMLTNLETIRRSVRRLRKIEQMRDDGILDQLPTKEVSQLNKEKVKLEYNLSGIRQMKKLPAAVFVVDTVREVIAVNEARRLNIPLLGMVDTNGNPDVVQYPIPSNDDAIRAIRLITETIAKACQDGDKIYLEKSGAQVSEVSEEETESMELARKLEKEEQILEKEKVEI